MLDKKFLQKVTQTFGVVYQREMMIEECSEFIIAIQAIQKISDTTPKQRILVTENYAEEFVDVEIILTELKTALDKKIYNKTLKSKKIKSYKKLIFTKYDYVIRNVMVTKCCELIKAIQKVKRLEQKIGFVDDYKNKTNSDAKKSTSTYIEKLVYVEVTLNALRKSVDKKIYDKSLKYKLTRLRKRLSDKEKENKKVRVPIGRPKSISKNWDEHITRVKLKSNKRKNNVIKP